MDAACKVLNGWCAYYGPEGYVDSAGAYAQGVMTGSWYYYHNNVFPFKRKDYENGQFIKDTLYVIPSQDSLSKKTPGLPGEVESSFKGGGEGWAKYLQENLSYPLQAQKANIQGMVILQFIIDQKGKVQDPEIDRSVEYSLDEEALRIIQKSPAWLPASKDGKVLKSWKLQPVIFMLIEKKGRVI
ncbi:MAG: energy transducer TonB [Williamsia sp.]|nr:energy transducer TonB [Williamsia sp.]